MYFALYVYVSFCIHEMELKGEGCHFKQSLKHQHLYRVDALNCEVTSRLRSQIKYYVQVRGTLLYSRNRFQFLEWPPYTRSRNDLESKL